MYVYCNKIDTLSPLRGDRKLSLFVFKKYFENKAKLMQK